MASQAIPSFDDFKKSQQQAIPNFNDFKKTATPPAPPAEEGPLSKAWNGFTDTIGNTASSLWHDATDPVNVTGNPTADAAIQGATGPAVPLARMLGQSINAQWDQAKRAGQDVQQAWEHGKRGQWAPAIESGLSAGQHAVGAVTPVAGPIASQIMDTASGNLAPDTPDLSKADPARAAGMTAANATLAKAPDIVGALPTVGKATAGAVKGGVKGAFEPVSHGVHKIPIPASLAGAAAGRFAGEMFGPHGAAIGSTIGAATPIIAGAIKGAREALNGPEIVPPKAGVGPIRAGADGNLYRIKPDNTAVPILDPEGQPMKAPQRASATPKPKPKPAPPLGRTINPAPDTKVYPAPAVAFKPQPQEPAPTVMEPPPVKFRAPADVPAPKVYPAPPVAFKPAQPEAPAEPINPALSAPEAATPDAAVSNSEAGSPPTVNSVKHSAAHTDLMRQIHANARDLDLPGSPAGQNGHSVISKAAKDIYGVNSLAELPYEKLLELNQGLLRLKAVPNAGNVAPEGQ